MTSFSQLVLSTLGAIVIFAPVWASSHCDDLGAVDINTAPKDDLVCIIHIGDSRADQIVELRAVEQFSSIDDLQRVSGIGGSGSATLTDIQNQGLAVVGETSETEDAIEEDTSTEEDETTQDTEETPDTDTVGCVDINTASAEELEEITGVGEVIAERIIAERPFSSVDDLIRVSGIGETTLENIKTQGLACVDGETAEAEETTDETSAAPSVIPVSDTDPATLVARAGDDRVISVGDEVRFDARASTGAQSYTWVLGDGSQIDGAEVLHRYEFPGTYLVTLVARAGDLSAFDQVWVQAVGPRVLVSEVFVPLDEQPSWVELFNPHDAVIDIGGWTLASGSTEFAIPLFTFIAPGEFLVFSETVTGVRAEAGQELTLSFPGGVLADGVAFGEVRPGWSAARSGEQFVWTSEQTPAAHNVLAASDRPDMRAVVLPQTVMPPRDADTAVAYVPESDDTQVLQARVAPERRHASSAGLPVGWMMGVGAGAGIVGWSYAWWAHRRRVI